MIPMEPRMPGLSTSLEIDGDVAWFVVAATDG
jgi:hypothetical protein